MEKNCDLFKGDGGKGVPIWSLLDAVKGQSCTLERPLHVLEGHRNTIRSDIARSRQLLSRVTTTA